MGHPIQFRFDSLHSGSRRGYDVRASRRIRVESSK
jgi:hypothetical protein